MFPEIIGGDWPYIPEGSLGNYMFPLPSWEIVQGNGLGGINPGYFIQWYLNFTISFFVNLLHIPWVIVYKTIWFGGFIVLAIGSSYLFSRYALKDAPSYIHALSSLFFTANTYILMIAGGGQMGVAIAYALYPFVLTVFLASIDSVSKRKKILIPIALSGIVLGLQISLDPRLAFITILAIICYCLVYLILNGKDIFSKKNIILCLYLGIVGIIALLLNAFWLFPLLFLRQNPLQELGATYVGIDAFRFFSFAHFSDSLALLHPNWPENIFGKVSFMRSQYLLFPIIAFMSLLVLKWKNKTLLLYLCLLFLIGAFLAKGAQEPLSGINEFLFLHMPGFQMFRDPTKWYLLMSLSYAVLVPYTTWRIMYYFAKTKYRFLKYVPYLFIVGFFIFLIFPAVTNNLSQTLSGRSVPQEYKELETFLDSDKTFYRTLWVPKVSRFATNTNHPAIDALALFASSDNGKILSSLHNPKMREMLDWYGVKYIIIPSDPYGEIYIKNREPDKNQYLNLVQDRLLLTYYKKIQSFGDITVLQTASFKPRFFADSGKTLNMKKISATEYIVTMTLNKQTTLYFSEQYNSMWKAYINGMVVDSKKGPFGINSFVIPQSGEVQVHVKYTAEDFYVLGRWVTLFTLVMVVLIFFIGFKKRRQLF